MKISRVLLLGVALVAVPACDAPDSLGPDPATLSQSADSQPSTLLVSGDTVPKPQQPADPAQPDDDNGDAAGSGY